MSSLATTSFNLAAWPLYLAGAIFLLGVLIGRYRRVHHAELDEDRNATISPAGHNPSTTSSSETPTIRVSDSQRVDRLHRVLSLHRGQYVDLLELTFDRIPRLRIGFEDFETLHVADANTLPSHRYARIHIELGGANAGCGSLVKEVGVNQFLVPLATSDEHRCSILHFHGKGDVVNFLRIKLLRLEATQERVEIDVLHVCGHWNQ